MRWHMVLFSGDIMLSRGMLPNEKVGYEKLIGFGNGCIELNPLQKRQHQQSMILSWKMIIARV
jgi:hypothetical protein